MLVVSRLAKRNKTNKSEVLLGKIEQVSAFPESKYLIVINGEIGIHQLLTIILNYFICRIKRFDAKQVTCLFSVFIIFAFSQIQGFSHVLFLILRVFCFKDSPETFFAISQFFCDIILTKSYEPSLLNYSKSHNLSYDIIFVSLCWPSAIGSLKLSPLFATKKSGQ